MKRQKAVFLAGGQTRGRADEDANRVRLNAFSGITNIASQSVRVSPRTPLILLVSSNSPAKQCRLKRTGELRGKKLTVNTPCDSTKQRQPRLQIGLPAVLAMTQGAPGRCDPSRAGPNDLHRRHRREGHGELAQTRGLPGPPALHVSAAGGTHARLKDLSDQFVRHRVRFQPPHRSGLRIISNRSAVFGAVSGVACPVMRLLR